MTDIAETTLERNLAFIQRGMDVLASPPGDFEIDRRNEEVCMLWAARHLASAVVSIIETSIENGAPTGWTLDDFLALGGAPGNLENDSMTDLNNRTVNYVLNAKAIGEALVTAS